MAQDDYIKGLMNSYRPNGMPQKHKQVKNGEPSVWGENKPLAINSDFRKVLEHARCMKIDGDKKRLIKIDDRNEEILKVLYPVFSVDVTRFINLLLTCFFQEHPEVIEEIKKSFKKL